MPSHLRVESTFEPVDARQISSTTIRRAAPKPSRMSLTQTYYVASTARTKLGREAARADHNLRRLVGHANMLDQLMVELSHAEAEQDAWFNTTITHTTPEEPRRAQWIESIAEDAEEFEDDDDEDSIYDEDSDDEEFDDDTFNIPLRRLKSPPVSLMSGSSSVATTTTTATVASELELDDDMDIDSDDDLVESPTHSPPELTYDDSDSDEDSLMPRSPRNASIEINEKHRSTVVYRADDELVMQQEQSQRQTMIAAC